jgi:hypothetical protein
VSALWPYLWPPAGAGTIVGVIAGAIWFRRPRRRTIALAIGVVASIGLAALWHGPLGAADRFSSEVERNLRKALVYYEIPQVTAHLQHDPLTRRALLSGPADDFQRSELVRLIGKVPGVASARWSPVGRGVPLFVEGAAVSLLGFLLGLLLAYLVELHRRHNAQWNW